MQCLWRTYKFRAASVMSSVQRYSWTTRTPNRRLRSSRSEFITPGSSSIANRTGGEAGVLSAARRRAAVADVALMWSPSSVVGTTKLGAETFA